jgi:hypothetical protein
MPLMCTLGFGPEMIDFRTVAAGIVLLGFSLILSSMAEIWARRRRLNNVRSFLPLDSRRAAARGNERNR